ncbi:hypothetical protein VT84_07190 [Gemmata sp. SH-PL17]|uniref:hypothetical protein n=1 Tax=Gemmata sp. SH-PL17 TaxID=1630693 RepID=UPI00078BDE55|nr:hypothetical protein [Gemmata sp. SH-PL17]AMV24164.1 hypothetical protein VT84_07190 [Gemmata sp. SH-PL17]
MDTAILVGGAVMIFGALVLGTVAIVALLQGAKASGRLDENGMYLAVRPSSEAAQSVGVNNPKPTVRNRGKQRKKRLL